MDIGNCICSGQVQYVQTVRENTLTDGPLEMQNLIQKPWKLIGIFELTPVNVGPNIQLTVREANLPRAQILPSPLQQLSLKTSISQCSYIEIKLDLKFIWNQC